MNVREAIIAAITKDPDFVPKVRGTLRQRIGEKDGPMSTVVQSAAALEPIIRDAVRKRPSKLGAIGWKSAYLLASLAADDIRSKNRLARIAEKGTVGIVFVDVADFTVLTARQGDATAREVIAELDRLIAGAIKPARGEVVKKLGDGFLLAFPSASQSVRGAREIRARLKRLKARDDFPIHLRIAVHAGEPLIEGDDLLGHDVNLTARLLDHCNPGEIIVSEAAKELSEKRLRNVDFGRPRSVKIRGLSSRVAAYSI